MLPRYDVERGRFSRLERGLLDKALVVRREMHRGRDRGEDLLEHGSQRSGIGRLDYAPNSIDRKPVPVDGGRSIARMEPPDQAVKSRERVQVRKRRRPVGSRARRLCWPGGVTRGRERQDSDYWSERSDIAAQAVSSSYVWSHGILWYPSVE